MGRTTYINIFVILHNFFNELLHKTQKHRIEPAQADATLGKRFLTQFDTGSGEGANAV
jgi:hypothetical protein